MRLVDADLFDMALADAQAKCKKSGGNFRYGFLSSVRENLLKQPTVDAVPVVRGKWIAEEMGLWQHCSRCGVAVEIESMYMCKASEDKNFRYCPHCGSKNMEE